MLPRGQWVEISPYFSLLASCCWSLRQAPQISFCVEALVFLWFAFIWYFWFSLFWAKWKWSIHLAVIIVWIWNWRNWIEVEFGNKLGGRIFLWTYPLVNEFVTDIEHRLDGILVHAYRFAIVGHATTGLVFGVEIKFLEGKFLHFFNKSLKWKKRWKERN